MSEHAWENDDAPLPRPRNVNVHGTTTGRWRGVAPGRKSHTVYPVKFLVTTGSLETGFTFYGPFDHPTTAREWAKENLTEDTSFSVYNLQNVKDKT